jgi:thiamine biosynthesis lipoprotein
MMLHRASFHAMGCDMLAVVDSGTSAPAAVLTQVPRWFEEWEQVLSRFRIDSELTLLNRQTERAVRVSDTLWAVSEAARMAERQTQGLVTPAVLEAMQGSGYDRSFDLLASFSAPAPGPVNAAAAVPPLTAVSFDDDARTICLPRGLGLDFGGIAKGWAAQQAMKRLSSGGPALMDAAGDIAVSGPRADGGPWLIAVANPLHPGRQAAMLHLMEGGVATSGRDRRRWLQNGQWRHHIIDPLTGRPAETDLLTVTVIAPDVLEAEAAAKAAVILGSRAGLEWIEAHPRLAGLFILEDGRVIHSRKIESYL